MFSETVQASLLLLFADGIHSLLQVGACNLGVSSLLSLLLHLQHAPSVLLLLASVCFSLLRFLQLQLEISSTSSPGITVSLDLVALSLEVRECFLEGRGELLLREQVFLNCSDASFLVLLNLRYGKIVAGRSVGQGGCWGNRY